MVQTKKAKDRPAMGGLFFVYHFITFTFTTYNFDFKQFTTNKCVTSI